MAKSFKPARQTDFFETFAKIPDDIEDRLVLQKEAEKAIEESVLVGMKMIHDYLRDEYLNNLRSDIAATSLPNGKKFYEACIKFHTSTNLTAEEIHAMGHAEVEKIEKEITEVNDIYTY